MKRLARTFLPPLVMTACGISLYAQTHYLLPPHVRYPKGEAGGYLFSALGILWLLGAIVWQVIRVKPAVGCWVTFWGPDGTRKLDGEIVEMRPNGIVVRTSVGNFILQPEHFLSIKRPPAS